MKNSFFSLLILCTLYSCDDGDIIVTDFNFDEIDLNLCEVTENNFIYLKINNDTREGISFNFTQTNFSETTETEKDNPIVLPVNSNNRLTYRRFNTTVDQDYYCGVIPPSNVTVEEEFVGSSGTAIITTIISNEDDSDGLDEVEDDNLDTDDDGIPDYKDQDDDNDNVPTSAELDDNDLPIDTDGDGFFDHLDDDDDGDGLPTKYEEGETPNGDPRDDRPTGSDISNYLNSEVNASNSNDSPEKRAEIDAIAKTNNVQTEYTTTIIFSDLLINGLNESIVKENLSLLGTRTQNASVPSN